MVEEAPVKSEFRIRRNRKNFCAALATVFLLNPTTSLAQEVKVSEENQNKEEFVVAKTSAVAKAGSTITWEKGKSWSNPEWWEISLGEIQEYLRNHKYELIIDKEIAEKFDKGVMKEVMENVTVQKASQEAINRPDIRQAVEEGNEKYVEQELEKIIKKLQIKQSDKSLAMALIVYGLTCIGAWLVIPQGKKSKSDKNVQEQKTNKGKFKRKKQRGKFLRTKKNEKNHKLLFVT